MRLIVAWIKKRLGIQSPSCLMWFGYKYEYDYLATKKRGEDNAE